MTNGNQTIDIASHNQVDSGLKLGGTLVTVSADEINYLDGVKSNLQTQIDAKIDPKIPDSLQLTGTPTVPTANLGTKTEQIANTEFVSNAINALIGDAPDILNTLH